MWCGSASAYCDEYIACRGPSIYTVPVAIRTYVSAHDLTESVKNAAELSDNILVIENW